MKKRYVVAGILAAAGLICGGIAYYQYYQDAHAGQEYEKIKEKVVTEESEETPKSIVEIPIDFQTLQNMNPDIYAWIKVPGTVIDYPIAQSGSDNSYYLNKRVYGMLTRIVAEICESDVPQNYKRVYRNVLMVYIRKTIYNRKMVDCSYIKDIIKDYVNDEIIRSTINDIDKANYMQKIINVLVDKKKNNSLYLLLKVHVMARGI